MKHLTAAVALSPPQHPGLTSSTQGPLHPKASILPSVCICSMVQVLLALLPSCGGGLRSHPQALTLLELVYSGATAPGTTTADMQALQDIAEACTTPAAPPPTLLAAVQLALALHHKVGSERTRGVCTGVGCMCRSDHAAEQLKSFMFLLFTLAGSTHASGQFAEGSSLENLAKIKFWVSINEISGSCTTLHGGCACHFGLIDV